jgi:hypothetical protein
MKTFEFRHAASVARRRGGRQRPAPGAAAFHAAAALAMNGAHPLAQNAFKVGLDRHGVVRGLSLAAAMRTSDEDTS